jgi:hypothetical protein
VRRIALVQDLSKFVASRPEARFIAASILSFGMLSARAFWITRRSAGLLAGSVPALRTAIVMSLPIRANCFAIRFQRANITCFLTSKIRPNDRVLAGARSLPDARTPRQTADRSGERRLAADGHAATLTDRQVQQVNRDDNG